MKLSILDGITVVGGTAFVQVFLYMPTSVLSKWEYVCV